MTDAHQPPIADIEEPQPTGRGVPGSYLGGTKPLWKAFWLVFVIGNVAVAIVTETILATAKAISTAPATDILFNPYHVAYFTTSVAGLYFVYSAIVLWRCASTAPTYSMRYGVRIFVVLYFFWWLYGLVPLLALVVRHYG
jgi:hypothetical protein